MAIFYTDGKIEPVKFRLDDKRLRSLLADVGHDNLTPYAGHDVVN